MALSALEVSKDGLAWKLRQSFLPALQAGCTINFCGVPSNVGIKGDNESDQPASTFHDLDVAIAALPYQDFLPKVRAFTPREWQSEWDLEVKNKLHPVKPLLEKWHSSQNTRIV